ncbi:MAG: DUF2975 domain-containing protein [Verrucomicrobia bacterium]|nr:DUF2975 domain-containing protein [Verrucomicrobiota bacterium]
MAEAAPNPNPSPASLSGEDLAVSLPESWRAAMEQRTGPSHRIALIENSQRCLAYGWLSLVPVMGSFFILPAVRMFRRVDRDRTEWNPAAHLWLRGLVLACLGYWTSLLWLALLVGWLGAVGEVFKWDDAFDPLTPLGFLLLCGSAPLLIGLGCAAARWQNRFGAFVHRRRRALFWLMAMAYAVMLSIISLYEWHSGAMRIPDGTSPAISIYGSLLLWLIWLLGGLVCLVMRGVKSSWWFFWLAGAVWLTLWVADN